jgi:hypothetical protein
MNIQTAIKERLEERQLAANIRELRARLDDAERVARETLARRSIVAWIEAEYNISLDGVKVVISEQTSAINDVWYDVYIDPIVDCRISCTRRLFIGDDRRVSIEKRNGDKDDRYRDLWRAVRCGHYVDYDDLIDALIYATHADTLSDHELGALFTTSIADESMQAAQEMDGAQ